MIYRISGKSGKYALVIVLLSYSTCCLLFGGAGREGLFAHGVLQAIAGIGMAAMIATWPKNRAIKPYRTPLFVLIVVGLLGIIQIIPLPSSVWPLLPGRSVFVEGFASLNIDLPSLPISLDREATIATIGYTLIPIFTLLLCVRIGLRVLIKVIPPAFCSLAFLSTCIGGAQLINGQGSNLYFYEFTSRGLPVGFFSNVNHQATLLLMSLPFWTFIVSKLNANWRGEDGIIAVFVVVITGFGFTILGVLATGSIAGYALFFMTSSLIFMAFRSHSTARGFKSVTLFLIAFSILSVAILAVSPVAENLGLDLWRDSGVSRFEIWEATFDAIGEHWLFGTGLGTYESAIPMYEDPSTVTSVFVAKAHNEFLQVFLECGLVGLLLLILAIGWFALRTISLFNSATSREVNYLQKCAGIALVVVLLHSIVDYPARTPAIACLMSICVAIFAGEMPRRNPSTRKVEQSLDNDKRLVL
ncbi:MAG: O-antigen ligase family protein [Pseudomonadota bacterium]